MPPRRFFERHYHEALATPSLAYDNLRPQFGDHGAALVTVALFKSIMRRPPSFERGQR